MNAKKITPRFISALAMMFTLTIGSTMVFAQDKTDKQSSHSPADEENALVGVWEAVVAPHDCQTGVPLEAPFKALFTFTQGGTMSEDESSPFDGPYRNSAHGIWKRASGRNYTDVFLFQSFNPDRTFTGTVKIRQIIKLSKDFNSLTSNDTVEVYDPNGNLVFTGCGDVKATRLRF